MKIIFGVALALALIWVGCEQMSETSPVIETKQGVAFDHQHTKFAGVLELGVDEFGLADYGALRQEKAGLDDYLQQTAQIPREQFDQWERPERMAFLLNVYNASTLKLLVENPADSIKDLGGVRSVWNLKVVRLFGRKYSLGELEHQLIRGQFDSPAVHFALVCGSRSCPPLRQEPYTALKLEAQFAEQARIFLQDTNKNHVNVAAKELHLSPIFKWFRSDFGKDDAAIIAFVAGHFPEAERKALLAGGFKIRYTDYDWGLNQAVPSNEN